MTRVWELTIQEQPLTLTLAPSHQEGYCFKCSQKKEIRVISERPIWIGATQTFEERKFCQSCALENLGELERSEKVNSRMVQELRGSLIFGVNVEQNV